MDNERIQYRRCDQHDITALKQLWSLCFEKDTAEDIQAFFDNIYPLSVSFGCFCEDTAVTMLHLLPAYARANDCDIPVWYLYAGATHPSYRSRGYYRQLMEYAREWAFTSDGCAIYLRPAEPSLFEYYARLGYTDAILSHSRRVAALTTDAHETSIDEYLKRRERELTDSVILWQPIDAVTKTFIGSDWRASVDNDSLQLIRNGLIQEQLPLSPEALSCENGALWTPTTADRSVIDRLRHAIGYSLFYGD